MMSFSYRSSKLSRLNTLFQAVRVTATLKYFVSGCLGNCHPSVRRLVHSTHPGSYSAWLQRWNPLLPDDHLGEALGRWGKHNCHHKPRRIAMQHSVCPTLSQHTIL